MYDGKKREASHGIQEVRQAFVRPPMNFIVRLGRLFERLNDRLLAICKGLIIAIVATLAVILITAVFYRFVLDNAISWSEEGSKYLMVWLTFLGAPIALRHAAHINIDLLVKLFPPRGRQALYLVINMIIIATMGVMLVKGWAFAELGARQVASSFNFSMVWMYVAIPIGSALTSLVAIELALKALLGIADPEQGIDENMTAVIDGPEPGRAD